MMKKALKYYVFMWIIKQNTEKCVVVLSPFNNFPPCWKMGWTFSVTLNQGYAETLHFTDFRCSKLFHKYFYISWMFYTYISLVHISFTTYYCLLFQQLFISLTFSSQKWILALITHSIRCAVGATAISPTKLITITLDLTNPIKPAHEDKICTHLYTMKDSISSWYGPLTPRRSTRAWNYILWMIW